MRSQLLGALLTAWALGALAEDRGWHLQLGAAYRSFDDVQVESTKLRNYDSMYTVGAPLGVQGYSRLPGLQDGSGVTADQVLYQGGDAATDNAWAPVLGVQRDIWRRGDLSLRLTASLAYYTVDADLAAQGGTGDPGFYRLERSDSGSDLDIGLFASLSAGVHVTQHVSVELEYRFDEVSGKAGTSQAELDLSGQSGLLKVVFDF